MSEVKHLLHVLKSLIFPFCVVFGPFFYSVFSLSLLIYRNSLHNKEINLISVTCCNTPQFIICPLIYDFFSIEFNEFSFFKKKIYLFNLFILAVLGLRCGAQASHCGGFSCCGARAPGLAGFSSCGARASVVVARRL